MKPYPFSNRFISLTVGVTLVTEFSKLTISFLTVLYFSAVSFRFLFRLSIADLIPFIACIYFVMVVSYSEAKNFHISFIKIDSEVLLYGTALISAVFVIFRRYAWRQAEGEEG